MGVLKRMIKRTSRKLLTKLIPTGHSHQLVLNPATGQLLPASDAFTHYKRTSILSKRRKHHKDSAVAEALLLAAKNYLPPLQFHHVHGPTAQLSKNKCVARRTQSFCQALVFSNRVILPNERVYIKVIDIVKGWSGTIRFGFTSVDPATLAYRMPKHACPDMTAAGHTWARALADAVVRKNSVIHFSYTRNGQIHYGINNQDCGIFHAKVNTNQNLWFIVDVYGLTAAIELIDPRVNNAANEFDSFDSDTEIRNNRTLFKSTSTMDEVFGRYESASSRAKKRRIRKNRHAALLHGSLDDTTLISDSSALRRLGRPTQAELPNLNSVILPTAQQNIYSPMPSAVHHRPADVSSNHYHQLITANDHSENYQRANPRPRLAPAYSTPSVATAQLGSSYDEINDEAEMSRQLQNIHIQEIISQGQQQQSRPNKRIQATPVAAARKKQQSTSTQTNCKSSNEQSKENVKNHRIATTSRSINSQTTGQSSSTGKTSHGVQPKARQSVKGQKLLTARDNNATPQSKDCPICFERPINCVLYQCGHMCTCYECGVKQWRTQSRACPICRTIIKDVIKTYLS